jgi:hypothetical protein
MKPISPLPTPSLSQPRLAVSTFQNVKPLIWIETYHKPPVPDEQTVAELNRLASSRPFCSNYKAKKHDCL